MSNIQNRLNNLKPYVIGIRFIENISVIDVVLKEGWTIPKSTIVLNDEIEKGTNIFIFFSSAVVSFALCVYNYFILRSRTR